MNTIAENGILVERRIDVEQDFDVGLPCCNENDGEARRSEDNIGFHLRKMLYKENLLSFLRSEYDLCLLTEIPGNTGDQLIWAGTQDLLIDGNIFYKAIPLNSIQEEYRANKTLLVPGSGALTQSYHEWLPSAVIEASQRFRKVIILPSSYDVSVPIVAECLSKQNVFAFARDIGSYRRTKRLGRITLSFDCALYYRDFDDVPSSVSQKGQGKLLSALREDKDSLLYDLHLAPNPLINTDISRDSETLDQWIRTIKGHDTIITDRLHVAVASILLGKELIYLDPRDSKISNYFRFAFRDTFDTRITRCSSNWLLANNYAVKKTSL